MTTLNSADLAALIADRLGGEEAALKKAWAVKGEYPNVFVVDNLLPAQAAAMIAARFPEDGPIWRRLDSFRERKKTFAKLDSVDPLIAHITEAFHAPAVIDAISAITGMDALEADPSLYAGGLSMMLPGDFLNPHIDNSHDARRRRYRRLNLLYYVSPDWTAECGGNLEVWDLPVIRRKEIVSRFNRLVVMETNKTSWHSVSSVRAGRPRRCVSNYYFSPHSPDGSSYYHVTSFLGRPDQSGRRALGRVDNFLRQTVATTLGVSRGKHLSRYE